MPATFGARSRARWQPPSRAGRARPALARELWVGVAGGLAASLVTAGVDRLLDPLVSDAQKRRERRLRKGSAHEVAGPRAFRKLLGRRPSRREERASRALFAVLYGVVWGLVYTLIRRKLPRASKLVGLPFALPFFLACDGGLAPLLRLTPGLRKVPWQFNVKELLNHVAWTATAEAGHRFARRGA